MLVGPSAAHALTPVPPSLHRAPQRFVEDLSTAGKVDGAINFRTGSFSAAIAPLK